MATPRIYQSPFPAPNVPTNLSISEYLLQTNPDDVPDDKPILCDFGSSMDPITYGQLRKIAAKSSSGLQNVLGMREGDVVCIYAQNSVNWALLAHAVMWGGGCVSAINSLATSFELKHYLSIAKPRIIAAGRAFLPKVVACLEEFDQDERPRIIAIDDATQKTERDSHIITFPQDIIHSGFPPSPPYTLINRHNHTIPAAMIFSSGTSGLPKAVLLSHYNLIAYMLTIRATNPFIHNAHMREIFFAPFAHIYGLVNAVLLSAWAGSYVEPMAAFDFDAYIAGCVRLRASVLRLVPSTATRLVKDPAVRGLDLSSVKCIMCAGAALAPEIAEGLARLLPREAVALNGYGMSEGTITLLREMQAGRVGSVGRLAAGTEMRIVDDEGNDVSVGMPGECWVRGPTVFMGYKSNEKETAATFQDGWMKTGDVVKVDKDGFFWLTGRKKELIKFKGNQVPPAEIEAVLLTHPMVADAGVCGIWDKARDTEVPMGVIALTDLAKAEPRDAILAEITAFLNERVSSYKQLRGGLYVLEALPKGTSGKLLRRELLAAVNAMKRNNKKPKL